MNHSMHNPTDPPVPDGPAVAGGIERSHVPSSPPVQGQARTEKVRTTMFYDGGCPLCRREVDHYRRHDRAGRVNWVDIDRRPDAVREHGVEPRMAMERLHALDETGRLVSGVPAFVAVWRQLPVYRHLAWIVERLHLVPLLDRIYDRFAAWRFKRRCGSGGCEVKS
jgi:predicted DCC family thiol-disulfide oxidoreductase YuxK